MNLKKGAKFLDKPKNLNNIFWLIFDEILGY